MYMSKKYSEKPEKHLWRGLFYGESCWITYHNLLKVKSNKGALLEIWQGVVSSTKRWESSHDDNEGKSAFQTIAIQLSKQTKKQKKSI